MAIRTSDRLLNYFSIDRKIDHFTASATIITRLEDKMRSLIEQGRILIKLNKYGIQLVVISGDHDRLCFFIVVYGGFKEVRECLQ